MTQIDAASLADLEALIARKGCAVLRSFIDAEELAALRGLLAVGTGGSGRSEAIRWISSPRVPASLARKLRQVERNCFPGTPMISVGAFLFRVAADPALPTVDFPWHVDHESFYLYGQHRNYLNIWIPVEKERACDANLCVVPFDRLAAADPDLCRLVEGRGAIKVDGRRFAFDATGMTRDCGFDLDSIAEAPELRSGDLLVLRGDVLHRTQNQRAARTALSIRCVDASHTIDASHYYPRAPSHAAGLLKAVRSYAGNAFILQRCGQRAMSVASLLAAARELRRLPAQQMTSEFEAFLRTYVPNLEARAAASDPNPGAGGHVASAA